MKTPAQFQSGAPFFLRTRYIWVCFLAVGVFSYGWRVTEINLKEMIQDAHLVKPLIEALLQPDLVAANRKSVTVETPFFLGGVLLQQPPAQEEVGSTLYLSKIWGNVGDSLVIEGTRLEPERKGHLFWVNSIEQEFLLGEITTDTKGRFQMETRVPEVARGHEQRIRATLSWETGGWHVSRTLILAKDKIVETIFLALMATALAVVVAMPLSFLGARNLMIGRPSGTVIYYTVRTFFNILRSVEPLVLAILFAVWVGIGPFAGVLALGFHSIAALGKLYSEQIEAIDPGPVEAVTATGATPFQVVLFAVVPQVFPQFLAFTFYRWDINVRMSTIIGFVGGGGIGFLLQQWINLLKYNEAGTALLLIIIVVITLDTLSAKVREKIG